MFKVTHLLQLETKLELEQNCEGGQDAKEMEREPLSGFLCQKQGPDSGKWRNKKRKLGRCAREF